MDSVGRGYLRIDRYLAMLYLLITYISWQLHELGHWLACRAMGIEAVFGFNEWEILSSRESIALALAAGPLTTLLLVAIGFLCLAHRSKLVNRLGVFLIISNSLIDIGSALGSIRYAITHPDPSVSEPIWKLILLPIFAIALYLGIKIYPEKLTRSSLAKLIAITVGIGIAAIAIDKIVWIGIREGSPLCIPLAGISTIVIITNIAIAILTAMFIARYRHRLCA